MEYLVVDISENNGEVDFDALVEAGVKGVIIRASYGLHSQDETFLENVNKAIAHGLKIGAYHYSYALNGADAIIEADNFISAIEASGVCFELGVWFDIEDADCYKERHFFEFNEGTITEIVEAFLDNIPYQNKGVYASLSWLESYICYEKHSEWKIWNAQWFVSESDIPCNVWQYTDNFEIGNAVFDANVYYE